MFMSLQPSPWPDTTKLCSGEGQEILIDGGAHGEARSKTGIIGLFHNVTTVLPLSSLLGRDTEPFPGQGNHTGTGFWAKHPWIGKTAA
jgi:hypothetical protein